MEGGVMSEAIVFVCRGFASKKDMEQYVYPLEKVIINKFTNIPCYRVFLDDEIRREVFFKDGSFVDDMDSCLNLLISRKVKTVNIVPLLPSYGQWYSLMERKANGFLDKFGKINIAKPILDKLLNPNEMMVLEKGLATSEQAKERLVNSVARIIKIKKR